MCEECANSILENNTYDMSFIDLATKEIIPLEDDRVQFFVGDYAVHKVSGTMKSRIRHWNIWYFCTRNKIGLGICKIFGEIQKFF